MSDDPAKTVSIPRYLWLLIQGAVGILATGAIATLVVLVNSAISFSGRLSAVEHDRGTLMEIKTDVKDMRAEVQVMHRDLDVVKARVSSGGVVQ